MPAKFLCSAKNKTFSERKLNIVYLHELISSVVCLVFFFLSAHKIYFNITIYNSTQDGIVYIFLAFNKICFLYVLNIKMTMLRYPPPWISPTHLAKAGSVRMQGPNAFTWVISQDCVFSKQLLRMRCNVFWDKEHVYLLV